MKFTTNSHLGDELGLVDENTSRKEAAARIYALRKGGDHREIASQIVQKHGSRKSGLARNSGRKSRHPTTQPLLAL